MIFKKRPPAGPPPIDIVEPWYHHAKITIEVVYDRRLGVLDAEELRDMLDRIIRLDIPHHITVGGQPVPEEGAIRIMLRHGWDPAHVVGPYRAAEITEQQKEWHGYYEAGGE